VDGAGVLGTIRTGFLIRTCPQRFAQRGGRGLTQIYTDFLERGSGVSARAMGGVLSVL